MRDHMIPPPRHRSAKAVVGVRELKTHAARILRHVRETRASYILTHRGRAVGVILPLDAAGDPLAAANDTEEARTAWDAFLRAGRRLEQRFKPGASGVRLLSAARR